MGALEAETIQARGSLLRIAFGLLLVQAALTAASLAVVAALPQFSGFGETVIPQQFAAYFFAIASLVVAERPRNPDLAAFAALTGQTAGLSLSAFDSFIAWRAHFDGPIVDVFRFGPLDSMLGALGVLAFAAAAFTIMLWTERQLTVREANLSRLFGAVIGPALVTLFIGLAILRAYMDATPFLASFEDVLRYERAGAATGWSLTDSLVLGSKGIWTFALSILPVAAMTLATTLVAAERMQPVADRRSGWLMRLCGLAVAVVWRKR